MEEAIKALNLFANLAGTELNLTKCEGLWLGSNKQRQSNCHLFGIKWPVTPIRCLGIYIGHNEHECIKLNWDNKINAMDNVLKQANKRDLTLFGKVCIIKSLAIAKLIYSATCLRIPSHVCKEVDQRIFRFLWGKRDTIKRKSIINSVNEGGLGMIDIESQFEAIKAAWVFKIINTPNQHHWTYLPKHYIAIFGKNNYILTASFNDASTFPQLNQIPLFYKEVISTYNKSKVISLEDFNDNLLDEPIWGNRFLSIRIKLYFSRTGLIVT